MSLSNRLKRTIRDRTSTCVQFRYKIDHSGNWQRLPYLPVGPSTGRIWNCCLWWVDSRYTSPILRRTFRFLGNFTHIKHKTTKIKITNLLFCKTGRLGERRGVFKMFIFYKGIYVLYRNSSFTLLLNLILKSQPPFLCRRPTDLTYCNGTGV